MSTRAASGCISRTKLLPSRCSRGDLLVLPPAVAHRIELTGTPDTRLLGLHFDLYDEVEIAFEHQLVIKEGENAEERIGYWPVAANGSLVFARSYRAAPLELVSWLEHAAEAYHASRPAASLACRGYMQLVLSALVGLSLEAQSRTVTAYQKRLLELRADLHQSLRLPHTNSSLARRLNVSEDYFIRLFKQLFGESPQKYVQRLRHQAAKRYLLETDEKVERIGALVGYDDLHNFSHAFKKWQGISPPAVPEAVQGRGFLRAGDAECALRHSRYSLDRYCCHTRRKCAKSSSSNASPEAAMRRI
ncbi:helix-turn-helix transcriptional regulator [Cohnella ginsengisoli]|uniref:Helix-turn-helix transcriptional regulator n=1 Tax=Cohnella ginsengisoli TaxID=425004 RepID=A0A9X4KG24_9BACL|nr:helix-turn-helix transcriptional regulator [Cohnella ginsengisoli]MDG0791498.1 helix-turn-helix transcriptional regulator [Cohnella ginsengisoli]